MNLQDLTKEQLIKKVNELKKVLDRRPEARFARWVENGAFVAGVVIVVLSIFETPYLDITMFELSLAMVFASMKLFGKTVAVDLVKGLFSQIGTLAQALKRRKDA